MTMTSRYPRAMRRRRLVTFAQYREVLLDSARIARDRLTSQRNQRRKDEPTVTTQYADPHADDPLASLVFRARVACALETIKIGLETRGTSVVTVPDIAAAASEWTTSNVTMFDDEDEADLDGGQDYTTLLNVLGSILSDSMEG